MSQVYIDINAFTEMKELMDDAFADVINMSLQTLPEQLDGIKTEIENANVENLFNISHKMKSSCGSIGAKGLAEKARAIELISRQGSADIPAAMFNELHDATHEVLSFLQTELDDLHSA